MIREHIAMGRLLRGEIGLSAPGAAFKLGLLIAGLALAAGCGGPAPSDATQVPGTTVPNVVTSVPPAPTAFTTATRTPFPTQFRTPFPTLTPTPFVIPTPTPIVTPTGFVAPTMFPTLTPTPFRTPTPTLISTATPVMSVASSGSGQSQVHLDITVPSGTSVTATLSGAGVVSSSLQVGVAGADGRVRLSWTVNVSGSYVATGTAGNSSISGSVSVQ